VTDFHRELRTRVAEARTAYHEAAADDDPYSIDVRRGELESLVRIATDHGVDVGEPATGGSA